MADLLCQIICDALDRHGLRYFVQTKSDRWLITSRGFNISTNSLYRFRDGYRELEPPSFAAYMMGKDAVEFDLCDPDCFSKLIAFLDCYA